MTESVARELGASGVRVNAISPGSVSGELMDQIITARAAREDVPHAFEEIRARAAHDGRWNSSPALWTAMLDAALQGFPAPPAGVRQVNIEIPR